MRDEPKQETIEEAAERLVPEAGCELNNSEASYWQQGWISGHIDGAKWQAKGMYSEEEVEKIAVKIYNKLVKHDAITLPMFKKWFEQFKK